VERALLPAALDVDFDLDSDLGFDLDSGPRPPTLQRPEDFR
jgi:hypothetical protein